MNAPITAEELSRICGVGCAAPLSADDLHRACFCLAVDPAALRGQLEKVLAAHGASAPLAETHAHLFAALPVFVPAAQVRAMAALIESIERVVASELYRRAVRERSPDTTYVDPGSPGGLLGFDFHLGPDGPRLIEINTNPGGVLINALLVEAQQLCLPTLTAPFILACWLVHAGVRMLQKPRMDSPFESP